MMAQLVDNCLLGKFGGLDLLALMLQIHLPLLSPCPKTVRRVKSLASINTPCHVTYSTELETFVKK